jgi:hypothetical protein
MSPDGQLGTHAAWAIRTSVGDRMGIELPSGAQLLSVSVDGAEAPVETVGDRRRVRLPPSAGPVIRSRVEVTYSQDDASAWRLDAPRLTDAAGTAVPVQKVLWRLVLPENIVLMGHDRSFSRVSVSSAQQMLAQAGSGLRSGEHGGLSLPAAGDYMKQIVLMAGPTPPTELSVWAVSEVLFKVVTWVVIVVAGLAMLKLGLVSRILIILAAILVLAVVNVLAPSLVAQLVRTAVLPVLLVLVAWAAVGIARLAQRRPRLMALQPRVKASDKPITGPNGAAPTTNGPKE